MICFPLDNTEYEANALGAWCGTRTRGVFSSDAHYATSANGDMTVTVSGGLAWLKAADFWGVCVYEDSARVLTIDTADGALQRLDAICVRLNKNLSQAELVVKKGAYAPTPELPAIQRNLDYDEIYLASVMVRAGATSILAADITDLRLDETYCGLMRDGVTGIPTAQLQAQAESMITYLREVIGGVIDGSQYMLKTEYAPDATAEIMGGVLTVTSLYTKASTQYTVQFTMPAGAFTSISIDGAVMSGVFDTMAEAVDFEAAPGVPVTLVRQNDRAFWNAGGGAKIVVQNASGQEIDYDYIIMRR